MTTLIFEPDAKLPGALRIKIEKEVDRFRKKYKKHGDVSPRAFLCKYNGELWSTPIDSNNKERHMFAIKSIAKHTGADIYFSLMRAYSASESYPLVNKVTPVSQRPHKKDSVFVYLESRQGAWMGIVDDNLTTRSFALKIHLLKMETEGVFTGVIPAEVFH